MCKGAVAGLLILAAVLMAPSAQGQQADSGPADAAESWSVEKDRSEAWQLAQQKRFDAAIAALAPQDDGVVDAFVVAIGLDSDAVFGREASEAAHVLARRYNAAGRSMVLVAGADERESGAPQGSPANLVLALKAVAERMNREEDVLILYATTHGDPETGLAYRDAEQGSGDIAPRQLAGLLDELGIARRMLLLSACYSGIFVPPLKNENTIIITAAAPNRPSFGCEAGNDWTFFGDALINNALRKPQPFDQATKEALALVRKWEKHEKLRPSRPQTFIGKASSAWLDPLEAQMPQTETPKVGLPAMESQ